MNDRDALKMLLLLVEDARSRLSRSYAGAKPAAVQEKLNKYAALRTWIETQLGDLED